MPFRDWDEVTALPLPIRGKTYQVPPMSAAALLRHTVVREAIEKYLDGLKELPEGTEPPEVPPEGRMSDEEFLTLTLGSVLNEMRADLNGEDGVDHPAIIRAGMVVLVDAQAGRDAAEHLWEHGPSPEGLQLAIDKYGVLAHAR